MSFSLSTRNGFFKKGRGPRKSAGTSARKRPPRDLEGPIHILIYNWLSCNIDGMVYHCPNGYWGGDDERRAAMYANRLKSMGARPGVLDLTLHWLGADGHPKTAYFEIKSEDGTVSDSQYAFMADLSRFQIPHRVLRSLRQCIIACRELEIPLKQFSNPSPLSFAELSG